IVEAANLAIVAHLEEAREDMTLTATGAQPPNAGFVRRTTGPASPALIRPCRIVAVHATPPDRCDIGRGPSGAIGPIVPASLRRGRLRLVNRPRTRYRRGQHYQRD